MASSDSIAPPSDDDADAHPHPAIFIDRADIQMALDAGFTLDELRYMLDLSEEFSPDAKVDGEDLGPLGSDIVRKID